MTAARDESGRPGTTGALAGTDGSPPPGPSPVLAAILARETWAIPVAVAVVAVLVAGVNVGLFAIEDMRAGISPDYPRLIINETTGGLGAVILWPLVAWWTLRLARPGTGPLLAALGHLLGVLTFWIAHMSLMAAGRLILVPLVSGKPHVFDLAASSLLYELLKDGVTYAIFVVLTLLWAHWKQAHLALVELVSAPGRPAGQTQTGQATEPVLALKSGAEMVFVRPAAIRFVTAAGNYAEIHADAPRPHFVRATLKELQERLPPSEFARIHRSHLVNRRAVVALTPTGAGDFTARLADGTELPVSRRFRDQLG